MANRIDLSRLSDDLKDLNKKLIIREKKKSYDKNSEPRFKRANNDTQKN